MDDINVKDILVTLGKVIIASFVLAFDYLAVCLYLKDIYHINLF